MLKKVFIQFQFGSPHEWTEQYLENIGGLGQYGWYWKIFTPNKYENVPDNCEIVPMTIEEFDALMNKKLGYSPKAALTEKGIPNKPVTDLYVACGVVLEDYIKGFDFWGITNLDVVFGRLDHFLPDELLDTLDVFTDDVGIVNGVFTLFRNIPEVNNIFKEVPEIKNMLTEHRLFGIDEYYLIGPLVQAHREGRIVFKHPEYYPLHSYDRLIQHQPTPQLEIQDDGSLWEKFKDVDPPKGYINFPKGYIAKEIMYFHFNYTKKWPPITK